MSGARARALVGMAWIGGAMGGLAWAWRWWVVVSWALCLLAFLALCGDEFLD